MKNGLIEPFFVFGSRQRFTAGYWEWATNGHCDERCRKFFENIEEFMNSAQKNSLSCFAEMIRRQKFEFVEP
jgi:hypothetical protein